MKHFLVTLFLLFVGIGCTKKMGPEETLRTFVNKSLDGSMTKSILLDLSTGQFRSDIESLNDEEMEKYLTFTGASRESLRINLSSCEADVCYLTYTLRYDQSKDGKTNFIVELKKIAEMRKVEERWLLANITDVKSYYDAQQPIEP